MSPDPRHETTFHYGPDYPGNAVSMQTGSRPSLHEAMDYAEERMQADENITHATFARSSDPTVAYWWLDRDGREGPISISGDPVTTAADLYAVIRRMAGDIFAEMPDFLSTSRLGTFDGAWRHASRREPIGPEAPLTEARAIIARNQSPEIVSDLDLLSEILRVCTMHDDADQSLMRRHPVFPLMVDLYLTTRG